MKAFAIASVIAVGVLASGCSTYSASRYAVNTDNVVALRTLGGKSIDVGAFTATKPGESEIMCRGVGPVKTPDGEPFSEFVRKALLDELKIANVYSNAAPVTLTGNLDAVDFSSSGGQWNLALTVKSSNGRSMSVKEAYEYKTSFVG